MTGPLPVRSFWVQIPALIEGIPERMADVIIMQFPGAMDDRPVFGRLFSRQNSAMRRNRHDIGRAVGHAGAGSGKTDLHEAACEVARRMGHLLVGRGDARVCRVIINTEMRRDASAARAVEQFRNAEPARTVKKRLRGLDHKFHF